MLEIEFFNGLFLLLKLLYEITVNIFIFSMLLIAPKLINLVKDFDSTYSSILFHSIIV